MARWTVVFFPPRGENHSPEDFIEQIQPVSDAVRINDHLDLISNLMPHEWPNMERFQKIYQLTCGPHRLYLDIDGDKLIVVCYVCRKRSQKAKTKDLNQAHKNLENYYQRKQND